MAKSDTAPATIQEDKATTLRNKNLELAIHKSRKTMAAEAIRRLGDASITDAESRR